MSYLSICITGIDGTGKSTIVNLIGKLFQKCTIQYMGLKNWETRFAKACFTTDSYINRKLQPFAIMHDLRYRIRKHLKEDIVVVFDRYTIEQYLEYRSRPQTIKNRIVTKLYEKYLKDYIYKPTITFYLTCDLEVSISRKNDINTENEINRLKTMKTIMDSYYKNDGKSIVVDTTKLTIEDTLKYIKKRLGELECFNTLMN